MQYLHRFSEASATAFADRNRYVGDVPGVPTRRAALAGASPTSAPACSTRPGRIAAAGAVRHARRRVRRVRRRDARPARSPTTDVSTTHLSVVDRWGNAVSYTSTIEATGGSGITVPGWGFLLNNELTDFNFAPLRQACPTPTCPARASARARR